jgi:hypothetical protein
MKILILLISILVTFSNCLYQKPNGPVNGLLFTDNQFPGEFNPSNDVQKLKTAEGCNNQILYLFMWGNSAAGSIALKNEITKIATIDHRSTNFLFGLFGRYCTIISGE